MLREQYEHFHDKTKKRSRPGKYKVIKEVLYEWYQKCSSSNFYPNGPLLKEEAMEIKINSKIVTLTGFLLQMDGLKSGMQRIVGEGGDVPEETVSSCTERLYSLENIWNMDESGSFFKALPDAGLVQKGKQAKGGKKSKQHFTIAFFVSATGQKIDKPIVIWKSKLPQCFKGLRDSSRPGNIHYF